ncbi:MAG: polyisoprenoid-binding protein YceI [Flavobacteriales bacterium]
MATECLKQLTKFNDMRTIFALLLFIFSTQFSLAQLIKKYVASPIRCETSWTGSAAFSSYQLTGTIPIKSGQVIIKDGWIQAGVIEFNVAQIQHEEKNLVNHLKSEDFFAVKDYPFSQFEFTEPCEIIEGKVMAIGELTIRDHKKSEQFEVSVVFIGEQMICTFSCTINRVEYGITHNSPSLFKDLKDDAIADEFTLQSKVFFHLAE